MGLKNDATSGRTTRSGELRFADTLVGCAKRLTMPGLREFSAVSRFSPLKIGEAKNTARQEQLPNSLMPEGLVTGLNDTQLRDLFAYLMSKTQAPLPK